MTWWLAALVLCCVLVVWIVKKLHFDHRDCHLTQRLDGKVVIITGCNQGIGYETVGELARRGARVIMACRDLDKAEAARARLLNRFGPRPHEESSSSSTTVHETQLICEKLDLQSPASIRAFASRMLKQEQCVHILINNAAINYSRPTFDPDGIESHLKVNYLSHFLLTQLLHPLLKAASGGGGGGGDDSGIGARVINVSSYNHRLAELNLTDLCRPAVGSCYSNSKLANVIHARELSERWKDAGIVAVSVHPGLVKTELFRNMPWTRWLVHHLLGWLSKTALQGSQTIVYCCLSDNLAPGAYYHECRVAKMNSQALDPAVGVSLWQASEQLVERWELSEMAKDQ